MNPTVIAAVLTLIDDLLSHAQQISSLISQANAAGQTALTPDQWQQILASDDTARSALSTALAALKPAPVPPVASIPPPDTPPTLEPPPPPDPAPVG